MRGGELEAQDRKVAFFYPIISPWRLSGLFDDYGNRQNVGYLKIPKLHSRQEGGETMFMRWPAVWVEGLIKPKLN